ncbi:hypothetical protein PSHT_09528 [Puccinia striiformis]|uniref:DASH complex subunit SPC19 n=1 Tax=Puccinia striiformis TaxID=27350 RepID=A0A2S4VG40_9BASI|nr:hypothetical protein PSHT_09528 [Puccinia striiformis]
MAHSHSGLFPDILSSLKKSGKALEKCNLNINLGCHSLDSNTREISRINQALKNSQFFEVVSVSEIRATQYQLITELEPHLKHFVKLTENGLMKLQKREQLLRSNNRRFCGCSSVISKRKRLLLNDEQQQQEEEEEEEQEEEEERRIVVESKDYLLTQKKLQQKESDLQKLRSHKNSILKELERFDLELSRESGTL